ncbi:MAG: hypothetical protein WCK84_06910 [Bacteroidota bacterium]
MTSMQLKINHESLFDRSSDAVILTIDGVSMGMAGKAARTFGDLYPETWKFIESQVHYPLAAGTSVSISMPGSIPFKIVFLAATLTHLSDMQNTSQKSIILSAFTMAMRDATVRGLKTIRCGLPIGGWRVDTFNAFMIISQLLEKTYSSTKGMELQLCILEEDVFESVRRFASNLGYKV